MSAIRLKKNSIYVIQMKQYLSKERQDKVARDLDELTKDFGIKFLVLPYGAELVQKKEVPSDD